MKNHEVPAGQAPVTPTGPAIAPGNNAPVVTVPAQTVVTPTAPLTIPIEHAIDAPQAPNPVIGGNMRQDQVSQDHVDTTVERVITHREIL